jgi:uridine kinase
MIGIGGRVGSGKSHFSGELAEELRKLGLNVTVFRFDWYLKLSREARKEYLANAKRAGGEEYTNSRIFRDWFDIPQLIKDLKLLKAGERVHKPDGYNIKPGTKDYVVDIKVDKTAFPNSLVLVEGTYIPEKRLRRLFDFTIYVDAPGTERYRRIIIRDPHRAGRLKEWFRITRESEKRFLLPNKRKTNAIVKNGDLNNRRIVVRTLRRK